MSKSDDIDVDRAKRLASALRLRDGLGFQARVISARANLLFHELTSQTAITPGQYAALLTLHQKGNLTLTELATAIRADRSTLTEMIRRLLREGLITRASNGNDRRSAVVSLSQAGHAAVLALTPGAARVQDVLLTGFSQPDKRQFMRWLNAISDHGG